MAVSLVTRVEAYLNIFQALPVRSLGAGKTEKPVKLSLTHRTPFRILHSRESNVFVNFFPGKGSRDRPDESGFRNPAGK
jgi:hypothetical protein